MQTINETNEIPYKFAQFTRKFSVVVNPMYAALKYGSLVFGIREALADNINIEKFISAGVFYTAASFCDYYIRIEIKKVQHKIIELKIDNLEKILKE